MGIAVVTTVGDEMEAEIVCGLLRANGIEAFPQKTDPAAISALGQSIFPMAGPINVLVDEANLDAARELLAKD